MLQTETGPVRLTHADATGRTNGVLSCGRLPGPTPVEVFVYAS